MRVALVLMLAACGSSPPPRAVGAATPVDAADVPADVPPLFAPLFEAGRSWTYDVETFESHDNDGEPMSHQRRTVTCIIDEVVPLTTGRASNLACDDALTDGTADPLTGAWAADPRGLWKLDAMPDDDAPALTEDAMLLAATPIAGVVSRPDDEELAVERAGDAWCVTRSHSSGDGGFTRLCFGVDGVTEGGSGWAGAESHDAEFTLIRTRSR